MTESGPFPAIPEEEDQQDEESSDPAVLKRQRGNARRAHTQTISKINDALKSATDPENLKRLQIILVRDIEEVDRVHTLINSVSALSSAQVEFEARYLAEASQRHNDALAAIDQCLALYLPVNDVLSIAGSQRSSRSTSSSARARLAEAQRLAREAELKQLQEEQEAERRAHEERQIFELQQAQRNIDEQRRLRQLRDEKEQRQYSAELLQQQVDQEETASHALGGTARDPPHLLPRTVTPDSYVGLLPTRSTSAVTRLAAPVLVPASGPQTQPTARAVPATPVREFFERVRGFTDRAISFFTPNRQATTASGSASVLPAGGSGVVAQPTQSSVLASASAAAVPSKDPLARAPHAFAVQSSAVREAPLGVGQSTTLRDDAAHGDLNPCASTFIPSSTSLAAGSAAPCGQLSNHPAAPQRLPNASSYQNYTPDAWIQQLNAPPGPFRPSGHRPPKLPPPRFNGEPRDWPMFIQSFKVQVHDAVPTDAERLAHLRGCLSSEIQRSLGEAILNPGLYNCALAELQRRYGSPQLVSQACVSSLLALPSFKDNDPQLLHDFSSSLRSVVATLKLGGHDNELLIGVTLAQLVAKLPRSLKSRWGEYSYSLGKQPSVGDLDNWLDFVSMAERSVNIPQLPSTDTKPSHHRGRGKHTTSAGTFSSAVVSCPCCEANHRLADCKKFKGLNPDQRIAVVKEKRVCYRCLDPSHLSKACTRSKRCGEGGCSGAHHPLLHNAPRMFP